MGEDREEAGQHLIARRVRRSVAFAFTLAACSGRHADSLQTVRHALVVFRIPAAWKVESTAEGGGLYEDPSSSAVLRLDVITFAKTSGPSGPVDELRKAGTPDREVVSLHNGNALTCYEAASVEDGTPILVRFWQLAHAPAPGRVRIAFFSLTTTRVDAHTKTTEALVALLENELRNAEFVPLQDFERR